MLNLGGRQADYGGGVGEGDDVEGLTFLESHQDRMNSTPATKNGKPNSGEQAIRAAVPHGLLRPK